MAKQGVKIRREWENFLVDKKRQHPERSNRGLVHDLVGEFGEEARVDQSTVRNVLKRNGWDTKRMKFSSATTDGLTDHDIERLQTALDRIWVPEARWLWQEDPPVPNEFLVEDFDGNEFARAIGEDGITTRLPWVTQATDTWLTERCLQVLDPDGNAGLVGDWNALKERMIHYIGSCEDYNFMTTRMGWPTISMAENFAFNGSLDLEDEGMALAFFVSREPARMRGAVVQFKESCLAALSSSQPA